MPDKKEAIIEESSDAEKSSNKDEEEEKDSDKEEANEGIPDYSYPSNDENQEPTLKINVIKLGALVEGN